MRGRRSGTILGAIAVAAAALGLGVVSAQAHHAPVNQYGPEVALQAASKKKTEVTLKGSRFGKVLFDGRNRVLYLFTKDAQGPSQCYGACAVAWPPFIKRGRLVAGPGVKRGLLGTVDRAGQKQVTYAGKPLYYYEHDGPGDILCHNVFEFDGFWYVVNRSGRPGPA